MCKNVIEQYVFIKKEIANLEKRVSESKEKIRQLEKEVVCDAVMGSREDLTIGSIRVQGIAEQKIEKQWRRIQEYINKQQQYIDKLQDMIVEIENFIQSLPDSEVRQMARFKYEDGMTWKQVAKSMGDGYTEDCCRQRLNRNIVKLCANCH